MRYKFRIKPLIKKQQKCKHENKSEYKANDMTHVYCLKCGLPLELLIRI